MKSGYPPQSLTIIPELPLASLGLKRGEQLIVTQKSGTHTAAASAAAPRTQPPASTIPSRGPGTGLTASQARQPTPPRAPATSVSGPDYVETEGGYLVHRVSMCELFV